MYLLFDFAVMVSVCGQMHALPNSRIKVRAIDRLSRLFLENLLNADRNYFSNRKPDSSTIGLISTVPLRIPGTRPAMSIASSRSLASIRK
jgi:hypothetical protein